MSFLDVTDNEECIGIKEQIPLTVLRIQSKSLSFKNQIQRVYVQGNKCTRIPLYPYRKMNFNSKIKKLINNHTIYMQFILKITFTHDRFLILDHSSVSTHENQNHYVLAMLTIDSVGFYVFTTLNKTFRNVIVFLVSPFCYGQTESIAET